MFVERGVLMFNIRKATPEDALGISIVNVYTWKTTYTGVLPDEVIDKRIDELLDRAKDKSAEIEKEDNFIVATFDNTIIGFCNYGKSRDEAFLASGEINALYILKGFQHMGLGKKLFDAATMKLSQRGYTSVIINCLQGNPALQFYKHMGGEIVSSRKDEFNGKIITADILYFTI